MVVSATLSHMFSVTRTLPLAVPRTRYLTLLFFTVLTVGPLTMVHAQWLTGPLVNATLLLTCVLVGPMEAVLLGLLPSPIALSSGLLPLALAPMVPFIMMGNALFILTFHLLRNRGFSLGIVLGAALKFLFLASIAQFLMIRLLARPLASVVATMMSWPQFVTAVIGGAIAFGLLAMFRWEKRCPAGASIH